MIKCSIILGFLSLNFLSQAQNDIPIDSWRTHFSYRDAHSVVPLEQGAYCAGSNSLFFIDLQDQSLNRLGKIDGLSDTQISSIAYHHPLKMLVIAYSNGNIDLLVDNRVINVNTILETPTGESKLISHISFDQNLAYLSADFGVVVLDLEKEEIREAYTNIGVNGEAITINFGTVFRDTLFLATSQGVLGGSLDPEVNLQDFENWTRFGPLQGIPIEEVSAIGSNSDQLLASIDFDGIYYYHGKSWNKLPHDLESPVLHITSENNPTLVTTNEKLISVDEALNIEELSDAIYPIPQSSALSAHGLWVADSINGLVAPISGSMTSVFPSGPFSDSIFNVFHSGNMVLALPPGIDEFGRPIRTLLGFYSLQNGLWTNYNATGHSKTEFFPAIKDLVDVTHSAVTNLFYFASFGEGIIEWDPNGSLQILDESTPGSTLENILPGGRNVLVSSVFSDPQGRIWASNYGNASPIHRYQPEDGLWTSYTAEFQAGRFPLDMLLSDHGDFWLRLDPNRGGGIMVFNPQSSQQKHLTNTEDQGGLPSRNVTALVIDEKDQVWIGTDKGVTHYPFPFDILDNPEVNASPVLIDGRPLLQDELVNCIAVDGGNRKWIGTDNGIWLFSEQGDSVINNFTTKNSPLPSNRILAIGVNNESGEVFMTTDAGMLSYRGGSTKGSAKHTQVKIFPNPVTREFNGLVGISGLTNNAIVKVADVTGKLVKEFAAAGGTAVWDMSDYQGRRVQSGVYLVFSSNTDGNETFIGKIAVIN